MQDHHRPACDFCRGESANREWWDFFILHSSVNFVVVAALSPISAGHCLVVPRRHVTSFAALPLDLLPEVDQLIHTSREVLSPRGDVVVAEHGTGTMSRCASCVSHAHLHLVASDARNVARLLNATSGWVDRGIALPLGNHVLAQSNYLYLQDSAGVARSTSNGADERHFFQRNISGIGDDAYWDSAVSPRLSVVAETIEAWGQSPGVNSQRN
jgi:diadenosine tetraphosphate (Ap4A) HIT family hydrolase